MIDNIKAKVTKFKEFETYIENTGKIDLKNSVSLITGELDSYPRRGKLINLEASINEKSAYLKGSIHKTYNELNEKGEHNHDDFSYDCAKETIMHLMNELNLKKDDTSLTNLELGFNIHLSKDPQHFLDYNLLMYDFKDHNKDLRFSGRGDYKEFQKTDYYIKIYNKSKQYNIKGQSILRVELKILSKRLLQKLGVYSLNDLLNPDVINNIYSMLVGELKKLNIIDDYSSRDIEPEDKMILEIYKSPNFWKRISKDKSYKERDKIREDFQRLMDKYNLNNLKKEVLNKVEIKFMELIKTPCEGAKKVA